jgi:hypothetical protein
VVCEVDNIALEELPVVCEVDNIALEELPVVCEVDNIALEEHPISIPNVKMPEEKNSLVFCCHKCAFIVCCFRLAVWNIFSFFNVVVVV